MSEHTPPEQGPQVLKPQTADERNESLERRLRDRKRAEEALQKSETRYRTLVESGLIGVVQIAPDGRIAYANPAMLSMFEAESLDEIVGGEFRSLFAPESLEVVDRELEKRSRGINSTYEVEIAGLRGGRRNVVICGAPLLSKTGELIGSIGSLTDITDRKRTEEALRNSESHYRTLFESANDAIFIIKDGVFCDCNPAAIQVFGRSRQELLGHSPAELSVARQSDGRDSWEVAEEKLRAAMQGKPQFFNWIHLAGDGSRLLVDVCLNRLDTVSGPRLLAIVRDVTERNRAEELLRKSEREKAAILDGLKDVTVEYLDPELRIIWRNNATTGASGCASAEMCGKFCYEVARNRSEPCPDCTALKALRTGRPHEGEVTMPSGRTMLVRSNPIKDANGQVVGVVHAAVDITERKRTEERLEHMQVQLAHVARLSTVGELAAEIAHELSQPLYAILNYAKASRNLFAVGDSPNLEVVRASNEKIERIAAEASGICKRLRSFSRRAEAERESCDVNEIVCESLALMAFEAREKKVVLETALSPLPLIVSATRVQIQQVFVNLLHNAIEAMEGVNDRVRRATIRTAEVGQSVEIVVSDNGVGLPAGDQRNIFEAFVTTKPDGLGMGLAISSTIVESHGGRLRAASNAEGGASFHCALPLVEGDRTHVD